MGAELIPQADETAFRRLRRFFRFNFPFVLNARSNKGAEHFDYGGSMAIFWRKTEGLEPSSLAGRYASMTREFELEPLESITIEPETRGDSRSLFRLFFNHRLYADGLTAAEVHGLVGDILERAALPDRAATIPLESLNASNDE